jgi:uncharacterized protein DUF5709
VSNDSDFGLGLDDSNESYHGYSVDDEDQPQGDGDSLVDNRGLADPLDEGYSPPEKWSAAQGFGNTPYEESLGESLEQRLAQEEPDDVFTGDDVDEEADEQSEDGLDEVGTRRAGRLLDPDRGLGRGMDTESAMIGEDVGIDGAGASAEEAAVHIIDESDAR